MPSGTYKRNLLLYGGVVALCLFSLTVRGADQNQEPASDFQQALSREMQKVSDSYTDVRKELEEEYADLKKERDEYNDKIAAKVRELKETRKTDMEKLDNEYKEFRKRMADAKVDEKEKRFIDEAASFDQRKARDENVYENALSNLQRLYRLNEERYNEMLRIYTAKENLEDQRYREERELASERASLENRRDREGLSDARKNRLAMRLDEVNARWKQAESRYENNVNALDNLSDMVEKRIKNQEDYLLQHESIMKNIAENKGDSAKVAEYTKQLDDLRQQREIDERKYQANLRYLQERLTMEQIRNRELAQIDNMKSELENRWMMQETRMDQEAETIQHRLGEANLTDDQKKTLEAEKKDFDEKRDQRKKEYDAMLKAIDQRRSLTEKSIDQRLAYLKDRNDLRLEIAGSEVSGENLAKFREQIAKLEEKRMGEERQVRDEMMALGRNAPAMYRQSSLQGGNPEARKERRMARMEKMRQRLDGMYSTRKKDLQDRMDEYQKKLGDSKISDQEKREIQQNMDEVKKAREGLDREYQDAVKAVDQRKNLEMSQLEKRQKYLQERAKILDLANAKDVKYEDLDKYNRQLRDLDSRWDAEQSKYRQSLQPLRNVMPGGNKQVSVVDDPDSGWHAIVTRAERPVAGGQVKATAVQARKDSGKGDNVVVSGFKWMGELVKDGYHDAVDYFTD